MAVELAFAKSGKMFAASEHVRGSQPGKKLACVGQSLARISRNRPRTHHFARSLKRQIENGREINIESKSPAVFADDLPVLAIKVAIPRGEHIRRGRRRPERIAKAIDRATLQVDASKQRVSDAFLAVAQQAPSLLSALNVSREQDDSSRLQPRQQGREAPVTSPFLRSR